MGFFSKLMFWKKDDLALGKDDFGKDLGNMDMGLPKQDLGASNDLGLPSKGIPDVTNFRGIGEPQDQQAMNQSIRQQLGPDHMSQPSPTQPPFTSAQPGQSFQQAPQSSPHELEVISAKLDAIKANLDAINQRITNIERIAYGDQQASKRDRW